MQADPTRVHGLLNPLRSQGPKDILLPVSYETWIGLDPRARDEQDGMRNRENNLL